MEDVKPSVAGAKRPVDADAKNPPIKRKKQAPTVCPYLDTINRKVLDFDFEKVCSISLSNMNVYACLVCGKYYQGRGEGTHAYFHALEAEHHVFINLHTDKIYCLPDNYEVLDASLQDIKNNLHPKFNTETLAHISSNVKFSAALDGTPYLPGCVGLNNIKSTDWFNSCMQLLLAVPPIRNFFIIESNYADNKSVLVHRFGEPLFKRRVRDTNRIS
jgi:U4/U6.U5 tri-snRNP-associated protein 2